MSVQSIEQLTNRFRKLDQEKTRVQTLLDSSSQQLEKLLSEAGEKFGTRDLDELKAKLKELESENESMKKQYQSELEAVENRLAKLESDLTDQTDEVDES